MKELDKVKEQLLQWLILFGQSEVTTKDLMDRNVYGMNLYWLEGRGYITENTKTDIYRYQLTDKAIEWIGEKNVSM